MTSATSAAPRTSRARALTTVTVLLAAAGGLIGAAWAGIAPSARGVVALTRDGERIHAYLGNEADHFFVAAFLMLGMLSVVAVVAAALVWQWAAHRGPAMVVALALGAIAGAALATTVGELLARLRYGVIDIAAAPVTPANRLSYVTEAPTVFFGQLPLQAAATLLLPAAAAAMTYAICVAAAVRDDLGGYPPVEPPLIAAGAAPPAGSPPAP